MNDADFKICPFCKETIRVKAMKCRYCGEWLNQPEHSTSSIPLTPNPITAELPAAPDTSATRLKAPPPTTASSDAQRPNGPQPTPPLLAEASPDLAGLQKRTKRRWLETVGWLAFFLFIPSIPGWSRSDANSTPSVLPLMILVSSIIAFRGLCARRTYFRIVEIRTGRRSSRRIYLPAMWSYAWRSCLLIAGVAALYSLGARDEDDTVQLLGGLMGVWLVASTFVLDVPYWIIKKEQNLPSGKADQAKATIVLSEQRGESAAYLSVAENAGSEGGSAHELSNGDGLVRSPADEARTSRSAPTQETRRSNYFIRHWRGDLSLGISYWANGMLGTFLVLFASNMLVAMRDSVGLKWIAASSLVLYALALLVSVWQAVGVWRSAGKHTSRGGSSGWATAARVMVCFGVLSTVGVFSNNYIPQSAEMLRILAGDKSLPAYKITVLPGGTDVEFRGGLRAGSARELEKILAAVPQAKVLHIESIGGRIIEAKEMSTLVRARQMTTYTSERCLSAATLVLMSGKERVIATDAKIGFHSGNFPGLTSEQMREMNSEVRSIMQAAGVSASFISRVLSTPPDQMWYPTFEEMRSAGVITSRSAGERFASSWGLPDVDWKAAVESISTYPCFRTIKQVEPATFDTMMLNFVAALRSGKSEGEAIASISEVAGNMMGKYMPAASDDAVLAMRDQWITILTKYKDKDSQACIAVFTQAKINYKRVFPDWNMTDSLLAMEKVISSGASKVPVPIDKEAADSDLSSVLRPVTAKYGDDVQLLAKKSAWPDNSQKVCDILLLYYQEIAKLSDKRSANLVRYLITSE